MNGLEAIHSLIYDGFDRVEISKEEFNEDCYNCLKIMKDCIIGDFLMKVKPEVTTIQKDLEKAEKQEKAIKLVSKKAIDLNFIRGRLSQYNRTICLLKDRPERLDYVLKEYKEKTILPMITKEQLELIIDVFNFNHYC